MTYFVTAAERDADRVRRSRSIAERELRFQMALKGQTPTADELREVADAAEDRERQRDATTTTD